MPPSDDIRITLRVKPEEHALLLSKAGDRPISTFIRETVLMEASVKRGGSRTRPTEDHRALAQVLALLGSSDLVAEFRSTAAKIDNGSLDSDEETNQLIVETRNRITQIHSLLMRALGVAER